MQPLVFPSIAASLAYATKYRLDSVSHATIMDLSRGEIYAASKGRGAWLNDVKLEVGNKKRQDDELIIGMNISRTSLDESVHPFKDYRNRRTR